MRRPRPILGRRRQRRAEVPAWLPGDGREWERPVHDDLPRLVRGKAVHIHFKIRDSSESDQGYEFTSQLYFDDAFTDQVYSQEPYADKEERDRRNSDDGIFQGGEDELLLQLTEAGEGYAGTFDIALDTTYG